jgi:quinolinate synthase
VEHVAKEWGVDTVIMVPDEFLARNVAANTDVKIIDWEGHCEVHEKFSGEDVRQIRDAHPGAIVLAHPECPPDVLEEADFAGSTSALSSHVKESGARKVVLLTECSMSDNVAADNPGVEFVKPCNLCPHMKRISLENIYDALVSMKHEVLVPEDIRIRAKAAIDAMLALGSPAKSPRFKVGDGVRVPVEVI